MQIAGFHEDNNNKYKVVCMYSFIFLNVIGKALV